MALIITVSVECVVYSHFQNCSNNNYDSDRNGKPTVMGCSGICLMWELPFLSLNTSMYDVLMCSVDVVMPLQGSDPARFPVLYCYLTTCLVYIN